MRDRSRLAGARGWSPLSGARLAPSRRTRGALAGDAGRALPARTGYLAPDGTGEASGAMQPQGHDLPCSTGDARRRGRSGSAGGSDCGWAPHIRCAQRTPSVAALDDLAQCLGCQLGPLVGGGMELKHHLERLALLLAAERDEERDRHAQARGRLSLAEREARGLALADVEAVEEAGLAGRALVTYARADGRALSGARVGVGSP